MDTTSLKTPPSKCVVERLSGVSFFFLHKRIQRDFLAFGMKEKKLKKKKGARRHAVCRSQVVPLLRDHFFPVVYYNIPVDFFFLSLSLSLLRLVLLLLIAPLYHYKYGGLLGAWPYRSLPFYLSLALVVV
ncbi:Uncharacterized protein APZ42_034320 [Daphnia magna]|uniref:Uncharacterized protein n=1 Tax=Daphnia magna TaxID=35525 RepID=A0A162CAW5_9CRUS|nr:Uncharacterized protein APZ42_034320 [Daphnia magna]